MRVLIVGCGYVGLPLGAELVRRGHEVWGIRRAIEAAVEMKSAGVMGLTADITRPDTLIGLPIGYDWVVHCVSASGGAAEDYRRVYVDGTRNLLTWLQSSLPERFVYTSSTSVYGQTDGSLVDETSPTEPAAQTARVLLEAERVILDEVQRRGLGAIILRVAGIYGPARTFWLRQYLRGEARMEAGGERILNMIHRDDVGRAVIAVLERGRPGEVYNVVDDEPVSQRTCFEWLSNRLAQALPATADDLDVTRKRGITNKRVCNRRLRVEVGCELKFPTFREGFEEELRRCF